jgi:hypothetical protein
MNDDPKWDELENYLRERAQGIYRQLPEGYQEHPMILHLGPQVEADEWPSVIGDE